MLRKIRSLFGYFTKFKLIYSRKIESSVSEEHADCVESIDATKWHSNCAIEWMNNKENVVYVHVFFIFLFFVGTSFVGVFVNIVGVVYQHRMIKCRKALEYLMRCDREATHYLYSAGNIHSIILLIFSVNSNIVCFPTVLICAKPSIRLDAILVASKHERHGR